MIFVEKLRATEVSLHETSNPKVMDTSDSNARRFGTEPIQSVIDLLTKQVGDLTLLVQKGSVHKPRDTSRMTCFNAIGHSVICLLIMNYGPSWAMNFAHVRSHVMPKCRC
jgi:hypothetical protein